MMENYVCEKCKVEIENLAEVAFCPKCGKNYHIGCWESVPNCINCQSFNKDFAKSRIAKASFIDELENSDNSKQKITTANMLKNSTQLKHSDLYNSSAFHYNIGGKLKGGATAITIVGIIIGIIVALALTLIDGELFLWGILIGGIIGVIGWLSSIILYAYGELVSSAEKTANILIRIYEEIKEDE